LAHGVSGLDASGAGTAGILWGLAGTPDRAAQGLAGGRGKIAHLFSDLPTMPAFRRASMSAFLAGLLAALAACGGGGTNATGSIPPGERVEVAPNPADQWTLVPPASVGMDAATLAQASSKLPANSGISAMLVMRHGQPVMEQYWNGYDKDTLHDLRSATKSITSLLVGIAIDQHRLGGVDDTVSSWLAADYPGAPALAHGMVLEDLLTMSSGLACNDWDWNSPGNEERMYGVRDWVQFWLDLPTVAPAGSRISYCTGNPVALGHVLANATQQPVPAFAEANLFAPLAITSARWNTYADGTQTDTGGHMHMRPRDMAKIGQLALQRGEWNGVQLVSGAWIDAATADHGRFDGGATSGYGYLWWRGAETWNGSRVDMFFANGAGGQYIFVVPELDLVAVFTGENYDSETAPAEAYRILEMYIIGAVGDAG
jgi:CubicO group peptidase (beta-lactamase class C family)